MSDFTSKSSSSLVVAEKNAHRPGGCVGIFFKLFDWNRRFAKNKLFPKKLLAPARGKQASKKFNPDENLPRTKRLLTADVNGGGVPAMKKNDNLGSLRSELKQEMRSPSLVARLMGLESVPVVKSHSSDKSPFCRNHNGKNVKFVKGSEKEVLNLDKCAPRNEFQPQKIQKTGLSERRSVNRFGADALQIRNVLSRSRKLHPKLASPVKSPRIAKSSSRLFDAATRILEPGLQATSRAKCALTYSNSMVRPMNREIMRESKTVISLPAQSSCETVRPQDLKIQTSCRNCGHALEAMDLTSDPIEGNPMLNMPTSNARDTFFDTIEESKPRLATHCESESEAVLLRSRYQPKAPKSQGKVIAGTHRHETISNGMHFSLNGQNHCALLNSSFIHSERDASSSIVLKHMAQGHSNPQICIREDRIPPRSNLSNMHNRKVSYRNAFNDKKYFIAYNRNVSQPQVRLPWKPDNYAEVHGLYRGPQGDALSTRGDFMKKTGTAAGCRHVESSCSSSSIMGSERTLKSKVMAGCRSSFSSNYAYPTSVKSRPIAQGGNLVSRSKDIDVVSFSFSSPLKSKARFICPTAMDDTKMDQSSFDNSDISQHSMKEGNHGEKSLSSLLMNGDALGILLEQKLKELKDDSAAITQQGRTTASILQELISALTAERPIPPDLNDSLSSDIAMSDGSSQADAGAKTLSMRFVGDRFSPGCVLDASFSNESCVSSSVDDSSGYRLQSDFMDLSFDEPQFVHSDVELSYSTSLLNNRETGNNVPVSHLADHISRVLYSDNNLPDMRLSTAYSGYTKEVLLNAELLFGKADHSEGFIDFLMGPFLTELEALTVAAWRSTILCGLQVSKGPNENPLRRFLFDCLVECLNVRYDRYTNSGFTAWCGLPGKMNMEAWIQVFDYEVRNWASLSGLTPDEIIDWEVSTSFGKWTDFEIEAFETGSELGQIIFQVLVDEVIVDFLLP